MLIATETLLGPLPPPSAYLEGYRILRTALWALRNREPFRTVLVTSSLPREGKTTVSLNLATVFALAGKRTIVVDGDAEQESLGRTLGIQGRPGVTDICAGAVAADDVLLPTELEALRAVSVGTTPRLVAELAATPAMSNVIGRLADQAEFLILDAAPVLGFSTALALAPLFDLVVVVARARNQAGPVRQAIGSLLDLGAKVAGVVVNDIQPQDSMSAASYYQYYREET
jgi:capsular exopolysaccharide synthesis family protein